MNLWSRLTYSNVVATLALLFAIAGGTVYAAVQLGKNDVKSKNIAKGAVKTSDLHTDAVTGAKVKNASLSGDDLQDGTITSGDVKDATITADDIAAGVVPALDADVTGSATGGPQGNVNTAATTPLPLSGTTSFTPQAGEVAALAAEAQFTLASTNIAQFCSPSVQVQITGQQTGLFVNSDASVNSLTPVTSFGRDADGPYGLLSPGTPVSFSAVLQGDADCTAGSRLDKVEIKIVELR